MVQAGERLATGRLFYGQRSAAQESLRGSIGVACVDGVVLLDINLLLRVTSDILFRKDRQK